MKIEEGQILVTGYVVHVKPDADGVCERCHIVINYPLTMYTVLCRPFGHTLNNTYLMHCCPTCLPKTIKSAEDALVKAYESL